MAHNVGNHDIYIIEVASEFRVRPAVAMVAGSKRARPGHPAVIKELSIRNTTDYPAIVVFASGFTLGGTDDAFPLNKKGDPSDFKSVKLDPNNDGISYYNVMIKKDGDLIPAKGESAPSVIVDP